MSPYLGIGLDFSIQVSLNGLSGFKTEHMRFGERHDRKHWRNCRGDNGDQVTQTHFIYETLSKYKWLNFKMGVSWTYEQLINKQKSHWNKESSTNGAG